MKNVVYLPPDPCLPNSLADVRRFHRVKFTMGWDVFEDFSQDMKRWCEENCSGNWHIDWYQVWFEIRDDAMMCQMAF